MYVEKPARSLGSPTNRIGDGADAIHVTWYSPRASSVSRQKDREWSAGSALPLRRQRGKDRSLLMMWPVGGGFMYVYQGFGRRWMEEGRRKRETGTRGS